MSGPTSIAIATGNSASAYALGNFGSTLAIGDNAYAGINSGSWFNTATAVGYNSGAVAGHLLSLSLAVGPVSGAVAGPGPGAKPRIANIAIVFAPNEVGTHATSDGVASVGVNLFSPNTIVAAGYGPRVIAGSIGQHNAVVAKSGPGININGVSLGGKKTAAARPKATASKASGTGRSARHQHSAQHAMQE